MLKFGFVNLLSVAWRDGNVLFSSRPEAEIKPLNGDIHLRQLPQNQFEELSPSASWKWENRLIFVQQNLFKSRADNLHFTRLSSQKWLLRAFSCLKPIDKMALVDNQPWKWWLYPGISIQDILQCCHCWTCKLASYFCDSLTTRYKALLLLQFGFNWSQLEPWLFPNQNFKYN